MHRYYESYIFFIFLLLVSGVGQAELIIDIVEGHEGAYPIAVVPFKWAGSGPPPVTDIDNIVEADLARSGRFKPLAEGDMIETPTRAADIRFATWRLLQTDYLLIGQVSDAGDGYRVEFQLFDVHTGQRLVGLAYPARIGGVRRVAHKIADQVYEAVVGIPGAFDTRIAYITANRTGKKTDYALLVADADGYAPQVIVRSEEPLLSPSWSPDGSRLAYVSFEKGNSSVWVQEVATGARERVAGYKGINGAPSWSRDGNRLAMALSKSGNLEIYILDLDSRQLTQLSNHWGIDTEPVWSVDGTSIIFTSDRGGKPQLYKAPVVGGKATRLTFEGDYNARASVAPDGDQIAMVHGQGHDYRIAVLDLKSGVTRLLTPGYLDESPSFAPNGSMVLYATTEGDRGVLAAVASDGSVRQRLILSDGDVREPAWSPYRH